MEDISENEKEKKRMYLTEIERNCLYMIIEQCIDKLKIEKGKESETIGTLWNLKYRLKKLKYEL